MASQLSSAFTAPPLSLSSPSPTQKLPSTTTTSSHVTIRCGPRDNRGPLVKGRILSTEAIQAVQALKRSHKSNDPNNLTITKTLSRLIKADLLATLRELLRQGHCDLALQVFSTVRSEPWYTHPDLSLYADLTLALDTNNMRDDIDRLIEELEMEDGVIDWNDKKGLSRLIRALIGAQRRESTVRIYRVMKKCGWGCSGSGVEVDEYVAKVLSKGLKKSGEGELAKEVDLALEAYLKACLGRVGV